MYTQKLKKIRVFDLSNAVEHMKEQQMDAMSLHTFKRILATESMYMYLYVRSKAEIYERTCVCRGAD